MNLPSCIASCVMHPFVLDASFLAPDDINNGLEVPTTSSIGSVGLSETVYQMVASSAFGALAPGTSASTTPAQAVSSTHILIQGQSIIVGLILESPPNSSGDAKEMLPNMLLSNIKSLMFHYKIESQDGYIFRELGHHLMSPSDAAEEMFSVVSQHGDSKVMIFSKLALQVPLQYLKMPLRLILSLSVNETTYNLGSITKESNVIRSLLDEYRFRPTKLPAREAVLKLEYILPISTSFFSRELLYSNMALCSIVIENEHPHLYLVIDSINVQYDATKLTSPSKAKSSDKVYPIRHSLSSSYNNSSSANSSNSSSNTSSINHSEQLAPVFQFEYIKNPGNDVKFPCIIHPKEALSMNFKIGTQTVNESSAHAISINQYFGEYSTPVIVWWKAITSSSSLSSRSFSSNVGGTTHVNKNVNLLSPSLLSLNIPWSLGNDLSVQPVREQRTRADESSSNNNSHSSNSIAFARRGSTNDNTFEFISMTDFHITCEVPPIVRHLQPFYIKFILRNKGNTASIVMFRHTPELFAHKVENICPFTVLEGIEQATILPNQEITKELCILALNTTGSLCLNEISLRDVGAGKDYFFSKHIAIVVGSI